MKVKQSILLFMILVSGSTVFSAEPAPEEDYQRVEGKWFRNAKDGKGAPVRIEQELSDRVSKVKIFDRNGKMIHSQQAKFKLQRVDDMNLFVYYEVEVLEGPKKGAKSKRPQPCVYRIKGDQLIAVEGIVNGDRFPVAIISWWRIKEPVDVPSL